MTLSMSPLGDRNGGPVSTAAGNELLNVTAVAELLACSTRTVRRLADSGAMPRPVRLASLIRWRRSDITAWLADGCPSLRSRAPRR